ncbi:hypothetical protein [Pseudonocardia oroxyli]|nr:hypothetical protein [Pseudonocardia oroxyli]
MGEEVADHLDPGYVGGVGCGVRWTVRSAVSDSDCAWGIASPRSSAAAWV